MTTHGILLAGGTGSRFGSTIPKQFVSLSDDRVIRPFDLSLAALTSAVGDPSRVAVVLGDGYPLGLNSLLEDAGFAVRFDNTSRAGAMKAGISALADDTSVVLVHSTSMPLARPNLFAACEAAIINGANAASPAVPLSETVKEVGEAEFGGMRVRQTIPRAHLQRMQLPTAFDITTLNILYERPSDLKFEEDLERTESFGRSVVVVPGDGRNVKLTYAEDLDVVRALFLLGERSGDPYLHEWGAQLADFPSLPVQRSGLIDRPIVGLV